MEIRAFVRGGVIRIPAFARVPDGTEVRVLVEDAVAPPFANPPAPLEQAALDEAEVAMDLRWATGDRFP